LKRGESAEALKILSDAKIKVGDEAQAVSTYNRLKRFCQIRELVQSLKNPVSPQRMEKDAKQLAALTSGRKEYANIYKYAVQRSRGAAAIVQQEAGSLSSLLYSEAMSSWEEKDYPLFHLYAVSLYVNAPKSGEWRDMVRRNYLKFGRSAIGTDD